MTRRLSRAAIALVVAPSVAFSAFTVPAHAAEADQVNLNILGITDFHGHISQQTDKAGAVSEIGATGLACYLKKERKENPNTSFVSAGDNIGGSPFESSILRDQPTIEVLNRMGLEASAVGNHEFDQGWDDLNGRVGVKQDKLAKFPYLGANVEGADIAPSTVVEKDGVKIAYIGAITPETAQMVSPAGIQGITFTPSVDAVNAEAKKLKSSGEADVVIGLVHEGVTKQGFSGDVDAVIAGHTHVKRNEPGQPLVVQPANYGMMLADIDVVYDKAEKKVTRITSANRSAAEMASACDDNPAPEVEQVVSAAKDAAATEGAKPVANIQDSFYRGSNNGAGPGSNRGTESTLNSMLADATLESVNASTDLKADIGVMNAGGVREDLNAGEVTFAESYAVQPFGNTLGVVDITGAEFKQILEEQWRKADRPVLMLGLSKNVQYAYDPEAADGERITHVTVGGEPLDPEKTYRVAASNFLLNEGDGYTGFNTQSGSNKIIDTGLVDVDAFNQYLVANEGLEVRPNQTNVGINFGDADPQQLTADQEVTLKLSSLSYTTEGEPKTKTVSVAFGYQEEGSEETTWTEEETAEVDNSITDQVNETGRATIKAKVPAGATVLRVTTDNGTEVTMPVKVADKGGENTDTDEGSAGSGDNGEGSSGSSGSSSSSDADASGSTKQQRIGFWAFLLGGIISAITGAGLLAWAQGNGALPKWVNPGWLKLPDHIMPNFF